MGLRCAVCVRESDVYVYWSAVGLRMMSFWFDVHVCAMMS